MAFLCAGLAHPTPLVAAPDPITQAQFNQLFSDLSSNSFQTRQNAETKLTGLAVARQLTGDQLKTNERAIGGMDLPGPLRHG